MTNNVIIKLLIGNDKTGEIQWFTNNKKCVYLAVFLVKYNMIKLIVKKNVTPIKNHSYYKESQMVSFIIFLKVIYIKCA